MSDPDRHVLIDGERIPVVDLRDAPRSAVILAPWPDMLKPDWLAHMGQGPCGGCGDTVVVSPDGPRGLPRRCLVCWVLEGAGTPKQREAAERMLDDWRALRSRDPLLFRQVIVALLAKVGCAAVTPATAARLRGER